MEYIGNELLTSSVLYAIISVSMEVDSCKHVKSKDRGGEAAVFHLGYLSFFFLSNHLLMKLATTPATTEMIKAVSMFPSFHIKEVKTLGILYHICNIYQIVITNWSRVKPAVVFV